jgi:hypothetical protein
MDADLLKDQTYLHGSKLIDRLFAAKLETDTEALTYFSRRCTPSMESL